jgi:hypothetical protein
MSVPVFAVKGWALTLAAAFFGFAVNSEDWGLAPASLIPTITFLGSTLNSYGRRGHFGPLQPNAFPQVVRPGGLEPPAF